MFLLFYCFTYGEMYYSNHHNFSLAETEITLDKPYLSRVINLSHLPVHNGWYSARKANCPQQHVLRTHWLLKKHAGFGSATFFKDLCFILGNAEHKSLRGYNVKFWVADKPSAK